MPRLCGSASGKVRKYYYLGNTRVAMSESGIMRWLQGDNLGSASLATDVLGNIASNIRYKPFGEQRDSAAFATNRKFDGMIEEPQAGGLYDFGARMYLPKIGRFVSADSIVPNEINPQSLNRFSFVRNSPVTRIDPTGHFDFGNFILGLGDQYVDNFSIGLYSKLNVDVKMRLQWEDSPEYVTGRDVADVIGMAQGIVEIFIGAGTVAASTGGEVVCTAATAGACAIAAPVAGAIDVAGIAVAGHGLMMAAKTLGNGGNRPSKFIDQRFEDDLFNRMNDSLNSEHLSAARRELQGEVVKRKPDGTPYDHITEVRNSQRGLKNMLLDAKNKLLDTRLTSAQRAYYEDYISRASKILDYTEEWLTLR